LEYYEGGSIPWLTSGEVNQGIINSVIGSITEDGLKNSSAKIVPPDSIVVALYGATAGKVGLLKISSTTNQAVCSILPHEEFEPYYLYHAIDAKSDWLVTQANGGAQPNISQGIIRSMRIQKPPLPLQTRFAEFVKQADKSKFALQAQMGVQYELLHRYKKIICNKLFQVLDLLH
jgi:restriction endonuclease S subunit